LGAAGDALNWVTTDQQMAVFNGIYQQISAFVMIVARMKPIPGEDKQMTDAALEEIDFWMSSVKRSMAVHINNLSFVVPNDQEDIEL
jgi:hypothetical protein